MKSSNLENARDPITGRLCFGMMGNVVPNLLDKPVREDDSRVYRFFSSKILKMLKK